MKMAYRFFSYCVLVTLAIQITGIHSESETPQEQPPWPAQENKQTDSVSELNPEVHQDDADENYQIQAEETAQTPDTPKADENGQSNNQVPDGTAASTKPRPGLMNKFKNLKLKGIYKNGRKNPKVNPVDGSDSGPGSKKTSGMKKWTKKTKSAKKEKQKTNDGVNGGRKRKSIFEDFKYFLARKPRPQKNAQVAQASEMNEPVQTNE